MTSPKKKQSCLDQSEAEKFVTQVGRRHTHTGINAKNELYSKVALVKHLVLSVPQFNSDGPLKSKVSYFQNRLWASYQPNYSQTDRATDLPMACKLNFVLYGQIIKKISALCASV